jgi:hypothetical protein
MRVVRTECRGRVLGRVADLGIGAARDGPTPTTESLSAAPTTTLTSETRARVTAVAGTIRTDGATVAATLLLDAVSRGRPPGVPRRQPGVVLIGEQQHRLPRSSC